MTQHGSTIFQHVFPQAVDNNVEKQKEPVRTTSSLFRCYAQDVHKKFGCLNLYAPPQFQSPFDLVDIGFVFGIYFHLVFDALIGVNDGAVVASSKVESYSFER